MTTPGTSLFISCVDNTGSDDVSGRNQLRDLQNLFDHLPIMKDVEDWLKDSLGCVYRILGLC
jgi:hypothetical protein